MSSSPVFITHLECTAFDAQLPPLPSERKADCDGLAGFSLYKPGNMLRKALTREKYDNEDVSVSPKAFTPEKFNQDISPSNASTVDTLTLEIQVECSSDDEDKDSATPSQMSESTQNSAGSAKHHLDLCSPCGFYYKGGCAAGAECKFCHLCPPGTIELRRKMKRKLVKACRTANKLAGSMNQDS